ncbi:MAG: aspartate aminotransferase family protein [Chloroflexota bacterium]|nr:aspartate aminotransferase family protein [Chloroflexota bacterium]
MVSDTLTTRQSAGANGHEPASPDAAGALSQTARDHVWIHQLAWDEFTGERLRIFDRGEGSTLWDIQGRSYIDGISGLWVVNAGHGRAEIAEAYAKQATRLAYASASSYTTGPAIELAAKLASISPGDLNRFFFSSGGSEAVETAIKIAKQVQAMRGFPRRYKIIARRGSYHGMTHGAMSLTAIRNEAYFGPFMYGVSHVPGPNRYRNDFGLEGEAGDLMAARYVEQEIENQGPETVAAVIGEPVSSAAGVHVPSPKYWQTLRQICDKHGVFLIADEVINGFGRTGTMFATEQFGFVPDLMTMAKGLSSGYAPIAATAVRESLFADFQEKKEVALGHLLTFGGHAAAAAAAVKNIEILEDENLSAAAAERGAYLMSRLEELRAHPTVGDVRGIGLLCGIELVRNKETKQKFGKEAGFIKRVGELLVDHGIVTRAWDTMHFAPPLVVTTAELDRMVAIADESLTTAEREFAIEIDG